MQQPSDKPDQIFAAPGPADVQVQLLSQVPEFIMYGTLTWSTVTLIRVTSKHSNSSSSSCLVETLPGSHP